MLFFAGLLVLLAGFPPEGESTAALPAVHDDRFFEMRVYYAAPGKLDDLQARFRNHTTRIFEKHGMTNVGYWVPVENPENKLIYVLAYPSREARDAAWKAFGADPEWQRVREASEVNGKLVSKVESIFMTATDYSPSVGPSAASKPRVFELRTYRTHPGKLDDLHARFRDHTVGLFSKHGMTHIGYWSPVDKEKGADETLIYILAHDSREAAQASFKAFGQDPAWVAARNASEAAGPIVSKLESVFMTPTDYSTIK